MLLIYLWSSDFYPRSPCGERPFILIIRKQCRDFYPRSPCGERRVASCRAVQVIDISIHALLAESDLANLRGLYSEAIFLSTLSLRRATSARSAATSAPVFLSTLSLRRATPCIRLLSCCPRISIHALLAESDIGLRCVGVFLGISIHALLAESDQAQESKMAEALIFLSTLSLRRATFPVPGFAHSFFHFYPRSPCGERRFPKVSHSAFLIFLSTLSLRRATDDGIALVPHEQFLSTLSLRRATFFVGDVLCTNPISIHALLAESDYMAVMYMCTAPHFYPRSPCGERRHQQGCHQDCQKFLSTLSLRRATAANCQQRNHQL